VTQGYIHVLTGDGKGKTTAALGLAIRAAGAGLKVYFAQFIKKGEYSEVKALKRYADLITIEQFGLGRFTGKNPDPEDIRSARRGLERAKQIMVDNIHDVVILDEANVAANLGLISARDLLDLIVAKPSEMEVVLTGRNAPEQIMEIADLVTEMVAHKHYYQKGVPARTGIDK
jgi:cob(I)alamin adenosyltransferase